MGRIFETLQIIQDIFDMIKETEAGVGGEIQLRDTLSKLDDLWGVAFKAKPMT